jgi:hypothetical protein
VTLPGETGADQAEIIVGSEEATISASPSVPVVRLRPQPESRSDDDSVYRYDRVGLIDALRSRTAGAGGR